MTIKQDITTALELLAEDMAHKIVLNKSLQNNPSLFARYNFHICLNMARSPLTYIIYLTFLLLSTKLSILQYGPGNKQQNDILSNAIMAFSFFFIALIICSNRRLISDIKQIIKAEASLIKDCSGLNGYDKKIVRVYKGLFDKYAYVDCRSMSLQFAYHFWKQIHRKKQQGLTYQTAKLHMHLVMSTGDYDKEKYAHFYLIINNKTIDDMMLNPKNMLLDAVIVDPWRVNARTTTGAIMTRTEFEERSKTDPYLYLGERCELIEIKENHFPEFQTFRPIEPMLY